MEKVIFNNLGQWTLRKSEISEHSDEGKKARAHWVWEKTGDEALTAKYLIPRMEEKRSEALSDLSKMTQSRINANGEKEYLLHRGGSSGHDREYHKEERTSWTPNLKFAHRQAYYEDKPGKVKSAWISESQLHSSLGHYDYDNPQTHKTAKAEHEWIVTHQKPLQMEQITDAVNPRKIK